MIKLSIRFETYSGLSKEAKKSMKDYAKKRKQYIKENTGDVVTYTLNELNKNKILH